MKTSKFSDSQIMAILKQAEAGTPAPELCREHGISSALSTNGDHDLAVWIPP
jgi:putative transposase